MPLAVDLSTVGDWGVALMQANAQSLGIPDNGIFYGDQERIPVSPTVCVETGDKKAGLYGAGRMTELKLTIYFLVYHSEIRAVQSNRRDADILAETIGKLLNSDATMGGLAIHSFVNQISSGYATKQNTTMRASRIEFEVTSQERLPNNL